jgi:hypothetical protein
VLSIWLFAFWDQKLKNTGIVDVDVDVGVGVGAFMHSVAWLYLTDSFVF